MIVLATLACDDYSTTSNETYTVTYWVKGTADSASLTYNNQSGNTEQKSEVDVPWHLKFEAERGQFLYISAQNNGESGTIKTQIIVDGDVIAESESEGAYVIASCDASAGKD
jgi:hypothetical protein